VTEYNILAEPLQILGFLVDCFIGIDMPSIVQWLMCIFSLIYSFSIWYWYC